MTALANSGTIRGGKRAPAGADGYGTPSPRRRAGRPRRHGIANFDMITAWTSTEEVENGAVVPPDL